MSVMIGPVSALGLVRKDTDDLERIAGSALLAWGVPRLRMTGATLTAGSRMASGSGARNVSAMLGDIGRLANSMRGVTGSGELALRRSKSINQALDAVPPGIRPQVATAAGLVLVTAPRRRENSVRQIRARQVSGW